MKKINRPIIIKISDNDKILIGTAEIETKTKYLDKREEAFDGTKLLTGFKILKINLTSKEGDEVDI